MSKAKRFKVVTLGCRTNQYESQAYMTQLEQLGYSPAAPNESASICIVNTCTVTENAHRESRRQIRRLRRDHPEAEVVITGCAVESGPGFTEEFASFARVVANERKDKLIADLFPDEQLLPEFVIDSFEGHTRAFVKVQDGCNSFCSYCIIPYVRGRSRSRTTAEVVREIQDLVQAGYKEVVLTGINIGDFDGGVEGAIPDRLSNLVRAVDTIEGLSRIRISSIDPDEVDDDLATAVLEGKHTCPSMHIVLQAGSNVILKRMNRKYTRQVFLETVCRLRKANPDFTFTTDVIVGFPGETERDFEETLEVMEEVRFAKVHMFPYSRRPRTRAALYRDEVPAERILARKERVLREAERGAYALRNGFVGRRMEVLTEAREGEQSNRIRGHTANFLPVLIESDSLVPNELVTVSLVANTPEGLIGHAHADRLSA